MRTHLLWCPGTLVDPWVQTVVPSFPALIPVAGSNGTGNTAPAQPVLLDSFHQLLVFLFGPGALLDRIRHAVEPSLATVLVVPARKMGSDLVPANLRRPVSGRLCSNVSLCRTRWSCPSHTPGDCD